MNDDSEALQQSIIRLLQDLSPDSGPSDPSSIETEPEPEGNRTQPSSLDLPDSPPFPSIHSVASSQAHSEPSSPQGNYLLNLGETPAVQDRFHALLKRRLESEIQRNPPMFPWETEVHDYESEPAIAYQSLGSGQPVELTTGFTGLKVPAMPWLNQLKTFSLPVPVPDAILAQLLQQCQDVVQSSLQEGAKLVRAVEELFPDQAPVLNHLASLVMASPARSGMATLEPDTSYPTDFTAAVPAQQMLLSLLAARNILNSLSFSVSANQPTATQSWDTDWGLIALQAVYEATQPTRLSIHGTLPGAGCLTLHGHGQQAIAQRLQSGPVNVELVGIEPNQTYALEVQLTECPDTSLTFAVRVFG